jgi:DNA-binding CsgD family transcriptional regulator
VKRDEGLEVAGVHRRSERRATLLTALTARRHDDEGESGLILLGGDDSIVLTDAAGEAWLAQLAAGDLHAPLPDVVAAVASRARSAGNGGEPRLARARVRTNSGAWLVVRGSALSGDGDARTAITLEPARTHDLAPLIADAYGLTERERAVVQLVAHGLATEAIGGTLHISPWTVQDHLKSIFEKVGVSTRGELVARVFFEHYAPRLSEQAQVGADGWFEAGPRT